MKDPINVRIFPDVRNRRGVRGVRIFRDVRNLPSRLREPEMVDISFSPTLRQG